MSIIKRLPVNTEGRDFVIGDLHGCLELLAKAMSGLNFDTSKDRIISVGDLVDRGPENESCLRLLTNPWFHAVMGNHESMMIDYFFVTGQNGDYWLRNGGMWGLQHTHEQTEYSMEVRDHIKLAEALPLLITVEQPNGKVFHVLHAELNEIEPVTDADFADEQKFLQMAKQYSMDGDTVTWGRYIFYGLYAKVMNDHAKAKWLRGAELHKLGKMFGDNLSVIYSGHTPVAAPTRFMGQINIDTMAYDSVKQEPEHAWSGLTITEPLTGKFWKATPSSFEEVELLTLK